MRTEIIGIELNGQKSKVTFQSFPNFFDKLRGNKGRIWTEKLVTEYDRWKYGGGFVYYNESGGRVPNGDYVGETIDRVYNKQRLKIN